MVGGRIKLMDFSKLKSEAPKLGGILAILAIVGGIALLASVGGLFAWFLAH